jgi:hypothetical protein
MARLTSPSGASVEVDDSKVEGLLIRGFTAEESKAPAKKSASSKSSK